MRRIFPALRRQSQVLRRGTFLFVGKEPGFGDPIQVAEGRKRSGGAKGGRAAGMGAEGGDGAGSEIGADLAASGERQEKVARHILLINSLLGKHSREISQGKCGKFFIFVEVCQISVVIPALRSLKTARLPIRHLPPMRQRLR